MALNSQKFRKSWSGGYDNFTRQINKINTSNFKGFGQKIKSFYKKRSTKKNRVHAKKMMLAEFNYS